MLKMLKMLNKNKIKYTDVKNVKKKKKNNLT